MDKTQENAVPDHQNKVERDAVELRLLLSKMRAQIYQLELDVNELSIDLYKMKEDQKLHMRNVNSADMSLFKNGGV